MNAEPLTEENSPAAAELVAMLSDLGIEADLTGDRGDVRLPGGVVVDVKAVARPTLDLLSRLVEGAAPGAHVLVADRIGQAQRQRLAEAGWGWLDRSGHLRLRFGDIAIDRDIASLLGPDPSLPDPLGRPSGLAVALTLLARPEERWSVRKLARRAGVSVGATSETLRGLTGLGLLDGQRRPVVPDLFWSAAARWRVRWFGLTRPPSPLPDDALGTLLQLGLDRLEEAGWAAVGVVAAQFYGLRVVAASEAPRLYVPSQRALTWALRTWGEAHPSMEGAIRLAVPPTQLAVRDRVDAGRRSRPDGWPLGSPLVVAITLAADREPRSRELLEGWEPPAELGQPRVW